MVPAEILAEALNLIGIIVDTKSFCRNPSYQEYINNKYYLVTLQYYTSLTKLNRVELHMIQFVPLIVRVFQY